MIGFHEISAILSIALAFFGVGIYVIDTLRGKTRPHLFTWLVWTLVMAVAMAVAIVNQATASAWVLGLGCMKSAVVCLLAFRYGEKSRTKSDWVMFLAALSIIPIWAVTKEPLIAAMLATAIDVLGYGPTFRKAWSKPLEENLGSFKVAVVEAALSVFSVTPFVLVTALYPTSILGMNAALVAMLIIRRQSLSQQRLS